VFFPDTSVSSINKIDYHDKTEILLKVTLNTINNHPPADYNNKYNDYGDNVAYGDYDFTNDYLNKYHGMKLINGGFT
jgi:hypothetical protein